MDRTVVDIATAAALPSLVFRAAPFVGYAVVSARISVRGKWLSSLAFAALVALCVLQHPQPRAVLTDVVVAWIYLLTAAVVAHAAASRLEGRRCTAPGLLIGAGVLFLLLPALLVRNSMTMLLLATGFEVAFSAHSYWREPAAGHVAARRALGECLTFLLVNPVLVYPARGVDLGAAGWSRSAAMRMAMGMAGTWLAPLLGMTGSTVAVIAGSTALSSLPLAGAFIATFALTVNLVAQYASHASLAHFQIGGMRLLGYAIPERFNRPFLARSPDEFWRRWNTYLGSWLQRYVYLPLALRYQRALPRRLWLFGKGAALIIAFMVCGLAHEAAGYALRLALPLGVVVAFTGYGLAIAIWLGCRQLSVRWLSTRGAGVQRAAYLAGRVLSTALASVLLLAFGAIALPALAGAGLHPMLARWVWP